MQRPQFIHGQLFIINYKLLFIISTNVIKLKTYFDKNKGQKSRILINNYNTATAVI